MPELYQPTLRVALASDHAGLPLKDSLKALLEQLKITASDLGTNGPTSVDYPDFAHKLAQGVAEKRFDAGILVCGTGIGMSMAANRHSEIRAALCTDPYCARMTRLHNDANVLCLGARVIGPGMAEEIVTAFFTTKFEGGRHAGRVAKLNAGVGNQGS
jgi:ribose 5-phosphate isomerase B